jgi:hypothetical protein
MAHGIGAPITIAINGSCCIAGAVWFSTRLKYIRSLIRPIYIDLGILPSEVSAVIEDASIT